MNNTKAAISDLTSSVAIPHGMRKYMNSTVGTLSVSNGHIKIQDGDQPILDIPLSDIKRIKIQLNVFYIYTTQGMKEVSLQTKDKRPDTVDEELTKWEIVFSKANVKLKGRGAIIFFVVLMILGWLSLMIKIFS